MNNEQLVEKVREFREEIFNLRVRNSTGELENTARMREARGRSRGRLRSRASGTSTLTPSCVNNGASAAGAKHVTLGGGEADRYRKRI